MADSSNFRQRIYQAMEQLPEGQLTTYGDLAAMAGQPRAARIVGGICHYGPTELPWHRVVNRLGGLARGFPGGPEVQQQLLAQDGITCTDYVVDNFTQLRWKPDMMTDTADPALHAQAGLASQRPAGPVSQRPAGPAVESAPNFDPITDPKLGATPLDVTRTSASSISDLPSPNYQLPTTAYHLPSPTSHLPLIVIVGPTASGKTGLAIELAEKFNGEIICADSRSIYKGMDIGTAKPTQAEQARVKHWGLDLAEPNQTFTVADFKDYAQQTIASIRARGKVPFLVGGSGLYVDAIIFDYQFGSPSDPALRQQLEAKTIQQLQDYCMENNIDLPENRHNKRYLIRAIEQKGINHKRQQQPIDNTIIVGISTDRQVLRQRIGLRAEQIFEDGVVKEAILLGKKYGWDSPAMTGNIYPLVHAYLQDQLSLQEVKDKFVILDWRLAKRQLTWLRRNQHINWHSLSQARDLLSQQLAIE